jgi:DNA polymerase I-like protein with 3'-5' exonuclease and polymerase domains
MPLGVRTFEQLDEVVEAYSDFDEFVVDVETLGERRNDPHRNNVFWISLSGPGRADAIPCGHPIGERIIRDPEDDFYRINPANGHHQEHRLNETSGRLKWVDVPEPFTPAPKQLWISDIVERLRPLFFSDRRKVGQNVKFDLLSLTKYFGEIPPPPYGDTLVAAKLINENHFAYDLGRLTKREFKYEYEKIGKKGPENFPYSEAHRYSYLDAKYTWLLWCRFQAKMAKEKIRHIFDMEMDLLPVLLDMELTGTPVDEEALDELGREFHMEMARLQVAINKAAGEEVNLNANRQIGHLVYDTLGHECWALTPSGERSTSKETLEGFGDDPIVAKLLDHAQLRKLQGTFIDGLKKNINDGRIHPDFNQMGAVSGRLSCRNPNIQQIPSRSERGKRVRDVFVAGPGKVLIVSDLSQIELRVLAHFTQDPTLLRAYRRGVDLHSILAERVFGPDFTSIQRSLAKNAHFSVLYGAGPATMVRRYQIPSHRMAERLLKGFYKAYPEVDPWKKRVVKEAEDRYRGGKVAPHVLTILGRKRRLPELYSSHYSKRAAAKRQAISVTISGSAADLFKLVMIQCQDHLLDQRWPGHILMTVHDELIVEVPKKRADDALALVKQAMEHVDHPKTGAPILSVPIVADAKIVTRWSDAK